MIRALATFALLLEAPGLAAQTTWDPQSWTPDGWGTAPLTVQPLEDAPGVRPRPRPSDEAQQGQSSAVLVPSRRHSSTTDAQLAEVAPRGAVLRVLDRVSGEVSDLALSGGQTARVGQIEVTLQECRYPADNPASDAYAYIDIVEYRSASWIFSGWMLASSPALNPLDHRRYDVWVLRCNMS